MQRDPSILVKVAAAAARARMAFFPDRSDMTVIISGLIELTGGLLEEVAALRAEVAALREHMDGAHGLR